MKRTLCTIALSLLMVTSPACSFKIFEDVGSDPHPPTVEIIGLVIYVPPEPPEPPPEEPPPEEPVEPVVPDASTVDRAAAPAQGRSVTWNSGGFSLSQGQKFQIGLGYSDAGGDIESFPLRDRDGLLKFNCVPKDQTYFSGTVGAVLCVENGYELTGILGPHRLELWAEDSHLSRSEKVEFIITIVP